MGWPWPDTLIPLKFGHPGPLARVAEPMRLEEDRLLSTTKYTNINININKYIYIYNIYGFRVFFPDGFTVESLGFRIQWC